MNGDILKLKFVALLFFLLAGCNPLPSNVRTALQVAGENRQELEVVITHFESSGDPNKLQAAYYLIAGLPGQYHYKGGLVEAHREVFGKMDSVIQSGQEIYYPEVWDSLKRTIRISSDRGLERKEDIQTVTAEFLIQHIENSFKAWEYPWAKKLSFEEFCQYILPYKVKNEVPTLWNGYFQEKYQWLKDSLGGSADPVKACKLINYDLRKWFYFTRLNCPFDLSAEDLLKTRSGRCPEQVQITTYAMRAMGLPVTIEDVPLWANRGFGHSWNALITDQGAIPFLGTEIDPGLYKLDFVMPGSLKSKKPKVWRKTYLSSDYPGNYVKEFPSIFNNHRFDDVTNEYTPIMDIEIPIGNEYNEYQLAYLCVFNNLGWKPVHWAEIKRGKALFNDMGTGIVYLPVLYDEDGQFPIGSPFILGKNGKMIPFNESPDSREQVILFRKYPVGRDNEIVPGQPYELLKWGGLRWESLGRQISPGDSLVFEKVPKGALLWLRNLEEGFQERIFTIENAEPVWW